MEKHYVYLKDNRVVQIAVFAEQNEELADMVAHEHSFDDAIWVGENIPSMWAEYKDGQFIPPTPQYLYSIGILSVNPDISVGENN